VTSDAARSGFLIDRRLAAPLYHQIAVALQHGIDTGRFPPGSVLPAEPALARQLRVCRPTVHAALTALLTAGVVERTGGDGTRHAASRVWRVSAAKQTAPAPSSSSNDLSANPTPSHVTKRDRNAT
jgi:DNA-binding FadR family transcriptional regulator